MHLRKFCLPKDVGRVLSVKGTVLEGSWEDYKATTLVPAARTVGTLSQNLCHKGLLSSQQGGAMEGSYVSWEVSQLLCHGVGLMGGSGEIPPVQLLQACPPSGTAACLDCKSCLGVPKRVPEGTQEGCEVKCGKIGFP